MSDRSSVVLERRLEEAMDKLEKHHPQIAGRLRTIWRREDEAWARGEELSPTDADLLDEPPTPEPTAWQRFKNNWMK